MAEYASNAKGNAGLTTGIIGTSLAGLLALGAGNNGNGGFLSGLFGGNNNNCQMQLAAAQSEIARLGSELYANQVGTEVYIPLLFRCLKLMTLRSMLITKNWLKL